MTIMNPEYVRDALHKARGVYFLDDFDGFAAVWHGGTIVNLYRVETWVCVDCFTVSEGIEDYDDFVRR